MGDLFVETGVFEKDGKIGGENGERLHVLVGEVIELRTFEIENADDAVLVHHRDGELGAGFGIHHEIAGIGGDIGNDDRFTKSGGGADDAFAGSDAKFALDALAVFDIDAMTEDVLGFVVEHDAEDLVVDDALDEFGGAAKKFFDIEDGADFAADFVEEEKRFGLGANFLEQARVFNGDGKSAGEQSEDILLIGGEIVEVAGSGCRGRQYICRAA